MAAKRKPSPLKRSRKALLPGLRELTTAEQKKFGVARGYVPTKAKLTAKNIGALRVPRRKAEQYALGAKYEELVSASNYSGRYEFFASRFAEKFGYDPLYTEDGRFKVTRAMQRDPRWREIWQTINSRSARRHKHWNDPYAQALVKLGMRKASDRHDVGTS